MAEFTQKQSEAPVTNFTGRSEGIRASANTAVGDLFKDLAGILDAGVKEADRHIKQKIEDDVFAQVDAVQNEFGVGEATDLEANADKVVVPETIARAGENLSRLEAAYKAGGIKESHYWARMNSMVRQLRSKYPGYRGEVDDMVASVTGARPANALRRALFDEWGESQKPTEYDKQVEWATENGHLPADFFDRQAKGDPYTPTELSAHVAKRTAEQKDIERIRTRQALAIDQKTVNKEEIKNNFQIESNQVVQRILYDTTTTIGKSYADVQKVITETQQKIAGKQKISAEDAQALTGQIAELKTTVRLGLEAKFNESWSGNPEHSYAFNMKPEEKNAIIEAAMTPIAVLEEAMINEHSGILKAVTANIAAKEADAAVEVDEKTGGMLNQLKALKDKVGPDVVNTIIGMSPELGSAVLQNSLNAVNLGLYNGNKTIDDALDEGEKNNAGPEYYKGILDTMNKGLDLIGTGEVPAETMTTYINGIFGQDASNTLARMDRASQMEFYRKAASPAVTKNMLKLREMGDEESWRKYKQWNAQAFMVVYRQAVADVQQSNGLEQSEFFAVDWNPNTAQFSLSLKPGVAERSPDMLKRDLPAQQRKFAALNVAIQSIRPIIEAEGGDTSKELMVMLQRMGYNPDTADSGIINGMLFSLRRRMETMTAEKNASRGKTNGTAAK